MIIDTIPAILLLLAITLPLSVFAEEDPTAALKRHLEEMTTHMQKMRVMLDESTECGELERRHMSQMADHMEMMVQMMDNMHKDTNNHPMRHD